MYIQPIEKILANAELVTQTKPGQWRCKCPSHQEDKSKSKSLSVSETATGSVLIHCYAGCDVDAVVTAWGLSLSDLFPKDEYIQKSKYDNKPKFLNGKDPREVIEGVRFVATIVELGASKLLQGETLDDDDLYTLKGAAQDLREMLYG